MDGNTRMKLNYLDGLLQFSEQRGQPIRQVPRVAGKPVDMYQLQKEVEDRGGFRKVSLLFVLSIKWTQGGFRKALGIGGVQFTNTRSWFKDADIGSSH